MVKRKITVTVDEELVDLARQLGDETLSGVVNQALAAHVDRLAVRVVPTDFALARQVGAILHAAGTGCEDIVDAHLVAVCAAAGGGLVLTEDRGDVVRLAQSVPSVRIVARSPR